MKKEKTLYQRLIDAGVPRNDIGHHCSDMYVSVTPQTRRIVEAFAAERGMQIPTVFTSQNEVPPRKTYLCNFAYDPHWVDDKEENHCCFYPYVPKSPYYELQRKMEGDMTTFLELLDQEETDCLEVQMKSGWTQICCASVASFLLGFCGHLAKHWHQEYGFPVLVIESRNEVIHICNWAIGPNGKYVYLDARGATTSFAELVQPFALDQLTVYTDTDPALKSVPAWAFKEDEISDAMIDWLVRRYPSAYAFRTLKKPNAPFTLVNEEV